MKKVLFIFALLLSGLTFASSSMEKKDYELRTLDSKMEIIIKTEVFGCTVSCYATVTNTETGATKTFPASSTNNDCVTAIIDCQTKAINKANAYILSQA